MSKFTEPLDERCFFITDHLDFNTLYSFQNSQEYVHMEDITGEILLVHAIESIKKNKIGLHIKNPVYREIIKQILQFDQVQWLASQVRQNKVRIAPGKEIVVIALDPAYMSPADISTCQIFYELGHLKFVSITLDIPAYQKITA